MSKASVPALVDTGWLVDRLDDPEIQVLDCTVYLRAASDGDGYDLESGYEDWTEAHIPGSQFADLIEDLSETVDPDYPFQLPTAKAFADAVGELGVSDDTHVVLYDTVQQANHNEWAARLWWMFRVFGHNDVSVLDGGWDRWTSEDRPVSSATPAPDPATFTPEYRPELVADKEEVRGHINDPDACLINALRPEDYAAERIPSSVNVPAVGTDGVLTDDGEYEGEATLREQFEDVGATDAEQVVVTYCGGGIAASSGALALYQAGVTDAAVYDGSLSEWTADPDLPLEQDT